MLSKNETKYIQSLYHKKQRNDTRLFIAEGPKLADELIKNQFFVKHIYAVDKWLKKNTSVKAPFTIVTEDELSRISKLKTPNEVLVIAEQRAINAEPTLKDQFTIALDGIQDPGNLGTIIRIADWFGIGQIICSTDCAEVYNAKVVQSTMGSIARVNCWYKELHTLQLPDKMPVFGALLKGTNIYSVPKITEGLLVIGNESKGIREPVLSKVTHPVTIPKNGGAESLNAAIATGIIVGCLMNGR